MSVVDDNSSVALAMAGFAGVSWCLGIEINVSLFLLFKRRRGLYFWACALGIWGVILQTLFIVLADFGIWTEKVTPIALIYLTWAMMVISQSWILFSRLHLILQQPRVLSWIRVVLIFTSIVVGTITIVLGTVAQTVNHALFPANNIWDRFQTGVFFVQETTLSILYIWHTRLYLRDLAPLLQTRGPSSSLTSTTTTTTTTITNPYTRSSSSSDAATPPSRITKKKTMLHQLLYINVLVICLDVALLGIQNADLFYLAGAFKPAVYGVKLKLEFVVLNRLIKSLPGRAAGSTTVESPAARGGGGGGGVDVSRPWDAYYSPTKPRAAESAFDVRCLDANRYAPASLPPRLATSAQGCVEEAKV
ncbi:uncharacterized protein F4807DRAFT_36557 [Annulohypoxylon truncatum]|uniref:uncharacterized protein n=1 Tax=Annulohypoxylon truncatum TaxID=327061 RepID=UPI0020075FED|nr:uncharacterized protein F4807DRAFT_36557 [Annulohypoxylon truncatum]KAI1211382.1 hypothetical protein F4807DRAFT_36557 [Annulohypoxylon truncatum]